MGPLYVGADDDEEIGTAAGAGDPWIEGYGAGASTGCEDSRRDARAVNGTRLWFDVDGPALVPDGAEMRPTVLLLHGGPGSFDHS